MSKTYICKHCNEEITEVYCCNDYLCSCQGKIVGYTCMCSDYEVIDDFEDMNVKVVDSNGC